MRQASRDTVGVSVGKGLLNVSLLTKTTEPQKTNFEHMRKENTGNTPDHDKVGKQFREI